MEPIGEERAPGRLGWWERLEHGGEEPRGRRGDVRLTEASQHCTRPEPPTPPRPLYRDPPTPPYQAFSAPKLGPSASQAPSLLTSSPLDLTLTPQSSSSAFKVSQCPSLLSFPSNTSLWTAPPSLGPQHPLPMPQRRVPAPGPGASSSRLVPGTWQVHVDQQGLGGAALSHRRQELGGGRWGGW